MSFEATAINWLSGDQSKAKMSEWHCPYVRCSCMGDICFSKLGVRHTCSFTYRVSCVSYQHFWHCPYVRCSCMGDICCSKPTALTRHMPCVVQDWIASCMIGIYMHFLQGCHHIYGIYMYDHIWRIYVRSSTSYICMVIYSVYIYGHIRRICMRAYTAYICKVIYDVYV
jgi:hypothetical protein